MPRLCADDIEFEMLVEEHNGHPIVLLNGTEEKAATCVDTDEGWIERAILDRDGHLVIEGDAIKMERVYGTVELVWPDTTRN